MPSAFFRPVCALLLSLPLLSACDSSPNTLAGDGASASTVAANQQLAQQLPLADQRDFEQANRGLIAKPESLEVRNDNGEVIWRLADYDFVQGDAPTSVNPSLWRQAKLNNIHGLFKVQDGIYQLRGFDLSNMTLIEGNSGWIVIDPLTAKETAKFAMDFAMQHLPQKPVSAVLFTHSHIDHFGGVLGLIDRAANNDIPVIAPHGFLEEATSENIIAGPAMTRRASYMYGRELVRNAQGHVGSGLGKGPAFGTFGIIEPNVLIDQTGHEMTIDGVPFIFQYTPESEAPAEMTFYLPQHKAFCGAELVSRNMHNLYTLRGAKVRDARKWSAYIDQARELFADADTYFASHHWPIWGQQQIQAFLSGQRDTYKYIHDQTVRHLNNGLTAGEIAERLQLPDSLAQNFSNRGYYGTLKHNSRAVYQGYMGWYDGNPAHLDPLPESETASRYVQLAGGSLALFRQAETAFQQGDYRWAAELLNHLVFADPDHHSGRQLLARSYRQLGFQSESGPWRDVYLSAAQELLQGVSDNAIDISKMKDVLMQSPVSNFFDSMSVRLKAEQADEFQSLVIHFTDLNESHYLWIENAVLHHRPVRASDNSELRLNVSHELFVDMLLGSAGLKQTLLSDELSVDGSVLELIRFFTLFEKPETNFNLVTP
ncbi:alkyl/aryl-sulfatase [Bacterioplanoides pacificum]|uniref:Alkyl/aryl-sulfatase n=1 Tax=Bacterioplanoides pacificum TaxID=1171596 RepID=A0ABV7VSC0_9GAMM